MFAELQFEGNEQEAQRCLASDLVLPAYECTLKCSHLFNVLDARGAVSVTERVGLIKRIRRLAVACAEAPRRSGGARSGHGGGGPPQTGAGAVRLRRRDRRQTAASRAAAAIAYRAISWCSPPP